MGFVAKGSYRLIRSNEIGKEKLKEIARILKIPQVNPDDIMGMTIDIQLKKKKSRDDK
jgi:hypothetical protein